MKPLEEMGKFKTVVIDPPWDMQPVGLRNAIRGRKVPNYNILGYDTMTLEEIAALPIESVLDDDARVFCWTVNRFLPYTFQLMSEWGVSYSFTLTWVKSKGAQYPGSPRFNTEWCIVGRKGNPEWLETKAFATANYWPNGAHSEKPEGFYDLLRRVTPAPRLDIFGRRRIAGFYSWGDEAPEGEPAPDHYQQVLLEA